MNGLLILFAFLSLIDAVVTYVARKAGAKELNPTVQWSIDKFGNKAGLVVAKVVPFAFIISIYYAIGFPAWVMGAIDICMVAVIVWNLYQLRKQKNG